MPADRVFSSLNSTQYWLGADYRIVLVAAGIGMVLMWKFNAFLWPSGIGILLWIIGALCEKRDPRFFYLLPLRLMLKDRYEAGSK
jgi:type IV secretory pathway TrbD component